jgi:AcrR family transcriptional regulator
MKFITCKASNATADETRARILKEAERLFRVYGYAKTTVADIANACGMSSANVYRFFASKSQINEAICDLMISDIEARLHKIVVADAPASQRLAEFIELIAKNTVETFTDQKKVHEMVVVAMEEHWGSIERHLNAVRKMIAQIIESGMDAGEFKRREVESTARCVKGALVSFMHPVVVAQCCDNPNVASPQEMTNFILSALKA